MLLTADKIATRLCVSKQCVYTLISERLLPAARISPSGRGVRVRPEDLLHFLEQCKVPKQSKLPANGTAPAPTAFKYLDGIKLREAWAEKGSYLHGYPQNWSRRATPNTEST